MKYPMNGTIRNPIFSSTFWYTDSGVIVYGLFNTTQIGLLNLPPFIGGIFALGVSAYNDRYIIYLSKKNKGIFEPEMRLWIGLIGVVTAPAGMLLFGLTMAKVSIHFLDVHVMGSLVLGLPLDRAMHWFSNLRLRLRRCI